MLFRSVFRIPEPDEPFGILWMGEWQKHQHEKADSCVRGIGYFAAGIFPVCETSGARAKSKDATASESSEAISEAGKLKRLAVISPGFGSQAQLIFGGSQVSILFCHFCFEPIMKNNELR